MVVILVKHTKSKKFAPIEKITKFEFFVDFESRDSSSIKMKTKKMKETALNLNTAQLITLVMKKIELEFICKYN